MRKSLQIQPKEPKLIRPEIIYTLLDQYMEPTDNYTFHFFRGMLNSDGKGNSCFCYVISFLQLIFHCNDVVRHFLTPLKTTQTEIYLRNIINRIYSKDSNYYVKIDAFLNSWKGWNGNKLVPRVTEDTSELCQFLLNSCSKKIYELFKIKLNYQYEPNPFPKDTPYHKTFFLRCLVRDDTIQGIVDKTIKSLPDIIRLPKYLLIFVQRNEGYGIVDDYIDINRYININGNSYIFKGASIFIGEATSGHYTTIMKISNKYILFNDNRVFPLFLYPNCYSKAIDKINKYNKRLHERCAFLLYQSYHGPIDIDKYEEIKPEFIQCQSQNPVSVQTKMINTMGIIQNLQHNNAPQTTNSINLQQQDSSESDTSQSTDSNEKTQSDAADKDSESDTIKLTQSEDIIELSQTEENDSETPLLTESLIENQKNQKIISADSDSDSLPAPSSDSDDSCCSETVGPKTNSQPRPVANNDRNLMHNRSVSANSSPIHSFYDPSITSLDKLDDSLTHESENSNEEEESTDDDVGTTKFKHYYLLRKDVDVEKLHTTDLKGFVRISEPGSKFNPKKRTKESKYGIYRTLFKCAGKVLRELDCSDQGALNAEIAFNHLGYTNTPSSIIKEKGNVVYNIFCTLIDKGEFTFDEVKTALKPIVDWYKLEYGKIPVPELTEHVLIDNDLDKSFPFNKLLPKAELNKNAQSKVLLDNLLDDLYSSDSEDENYEYSLSDTDSLPSGPSDDDDLLDHAVKENIKDLDKDDSEIVAKGCQAIPEQTHMASVFSFLNEKYTYSKLLEDREKDEENYELEDDDNQFSLLCYDWKERAKINNVEELVDTIMYEILNPKIISNQEPKTSFSELRGNIIRDFMLSFLSDSSNKKNISAFVKRYLELNSNKETACSLIKKYKKLKNQPYTEPVHAFSTLRNYCSNYLKLTTEDQVTFLCAANTPKKWGGRRNECLKVTKETIRCLITLILDFPTMTPDSIATYINSPFGPNNELEKNISGRTVQRYLKYLHFTCKKCSFAPPNRNCVGLRIFRVAWSRLVKRISLQKNVLLGFVDEAGVTNCNSKNSGRGLLGVSPLVNCPLQKHRSNIVAAVFPGFGVVYRFVQHSMDGETYAEFLKDVTRFARKYFCNNKTEIVLIEDNCPIHGTKAVEDAVEKLKIALIPIVQYSPSLNEVVESYFGLVKKKSTEILSFNDLNNAELEIEERWKYNSSKGFTIKKSEKFYFAWIARLNACIEGEPMLSGHINPSYEERFDTKHLTDVTVNRIANLAVHDPKYIEHS